MRFFLNICVICFLLSGNGLWAAETAAPAAAPAAALAQGFVFEDSNRNGTREPGEPGLPDVRVSNQLEVAVTDASGRWELPAREDCIFFVIKPRGWMTPVNADQLPQFYYVHKPNGSPKLKYAGVPPTGPLPKEINFPLHRQAEPDKFEALFFGDPQPRDQKELDYIAHDVIEGLVGTRAKFGVTLGDILFDDLSLFANNNALVALLGIPWYNVIGNHDLNRDAADDRGSDETFERFYGPSYYAFAYGPVHFIVLDNVIWGGAKPEGSGKFTGGLGDEQFQFLEHLLPHIPEDQLLMLMMHVPVFDTKDGQRLYRLIENRPYTLSISGHTHWQGHFFLKKKDGWHGPQPHHHIVNVTVCGSWWRGEPDELGIPHATMADGAPNGYSIITFDGTQATVDFRAARRPKTYQMNVYAPERVSVNDATNHLVYVNVFGGSEKSQVRMRLGRSGSWTELKKVFEPDPYYVALKNTEKVKGTLLGLPMSGPQKSHHLWKARLPGNATPGVHRLWVQSKDMYGRVFHAARTVRVEPSSYIDVVH